VVEERMRSIECVQHWLVIGTASGLKNSAPITISVHFSSFTAVPCGLMLERMYHMERERPANWLIWKACPLNQHVFCVCVYACVVCVCMPLWL